MLGLQERVPPAIMPWTHLRLEQSSNGLKTASPGFTELRLSAVWNQGRGNFFYLCPQPPPPLFPTNTYNLVFKMSGFLSGMICGTLALSSELLPPISSCPMPTDDCFVKYRKYLFTYLFSSSFFEIRSLCVAQSGHILGILLLQPLGCWGYWHLLPHLAKPLVLLNDSLWLFLWRLFS